MEVVCKNREQKITEDNNDDGDSDNDNSNSYDNDNCLYAFRFTVNLNCFCLLFTMFVFVHISGSKPPKNMLTIEIHATTQKQSIKTQQLQIFKN